MVILLYDNSLRMHKFLAEWRSNSPVIEVKTSGSTGAPKPMWVEKSRMRASALITCQFLRIPKGATALLCLPTDYIAGKMMVVRAEVWPLSLICVEPSLRPFAALQEVPFFAAITPAQAYESLNHAHDRQILLQVPRLLIGGGSISSELETELLKAEGEVWSSYGMTETLSHIALRRIGQGRYQPLEGVRVGLSADNCLWIEAPHVCPERLLTHDLAEIHRDGGFTIIGRADNIISSGGIKIQLEEFEARLSAETGLQPGRDFLLTWVTDPKWGQALTLLLAKSANSKYHSHNSDAPSGSAYSLPYLKYTYQVSQLPLTASGKPARLEAHLLAESLAHNS